MPDATRDLMKELDKGLDAAKKREKPVDIDMRSIRDDAKLIAERFATQTGSAEIAQKVSSIQAVMNDDPVSIEMNRNKPTAILDRQSLLEIGAAITAAKTPEEAKVLSTMFMVGYAAQLGWTSMDMAEKAGPQSPYAAVKEQVKNVFNDPSASPQEQKVNAQLGNIVWEIYKGVIVQLLAEQALSSGLIQGPFKDKALLNYKLTDPEQNRKNIQRTIIESPISGAQQSGMMRPPDISTHKDMGWRLVAQSGFEKNKEELRVVAYQVAKIIEFGTVSILAQNGIKPGTPQAQQYAPQISMEVQAMVFDAESSLLLASILQSFKDSSAKLVGSPELLLKGSQALLRQDAPPAQDAAKQP